MTGGTLRVVFADDEPLVRQGIRTILAAHERIELVGEAADGRAAIALVARHRPDLLLVDLQMPDTGGLAAIAELPRVSPGTRSAVLTTFGTEQHLFDALRAGADSFLIKAAAPAELQSAVVATAEGGVVIAPRLAGALVSAYRRAQPASPDARVATLTPRERDVLRLLSLGRTNAEIARELFLSEATVKGHVSSILLRLGAANRVEAALIGHAHALE